MMPLAQTILPTFAAPALAAAGAAAVAVPIAIHLLARRQRRPEPWAAMRFLIEAYRRHRMRVRLEQWLLLAVRCLLVLLLGLALAGPVVSAMGGAGGLLSAGRVFVLVIDDGVTSRVEDAGGEIRFDDLRRTALDVLDDLGSADRVAVVRASRPVEALIAPPTPDLSAARREVRAMQPTAAASDLPAALRAALTILKDDDVPDTLRRHVMLLSDFSAGATDVDNPLPRSLAALGEQAKLTAIRPTPAAANVQIASIRPDQSVVLSADDGEPTMVTWLVTCRRFGEVSEPLRTSVQLRAPGSSSISQPVNFAAHQREAVVSVAMPLDGEGELEATAALTGVPVGRDTLRVDNERFGLVDVRRRLSVMMVDRRDSPVIEDGRYPPALWLTAALDPRAETMPWPIRVARLDPANVETDRLKQAAVVFILRPDLLDAAAWSDLAAWTETGGIACVVAPPHTEAGLWPRQLLEQFDLGWSLAMEPVEHDPALTTTAREEADDLGRLRADLEDLLRPVRWMRTVPIDRESVAGPAQPLLLGSNGQPLLLTTPAGRGRLVLFAAAFDEDWTNLMTKPLFVPLVHETLRASLDALAPQRELAPGDQPQLGGPWLSSARLRGPGDTELLLVRSTPDDAATEDDGSTADAVSPISPLTAPGVYRGESAALVVNVDADAADTGAVDPEVVEAWLTASGSWRVVAPADLNAAATAESARADLSWPLLLAVLVLAVVESLLSRRASHASTAGRVSDAMHLRRAA